MKMAVNVRQSFVPFLKEIGIIGRGMESVTEYQRFYNFLNTYPKLCSIPRGVQRSEKRRTVWLPRQDYKTILRIARDIPREDSGKRRKKKPISSVMERILLDYQAKIRAEREEDRRRELQTIRDEMKQHGFSK
jgi:hypothetical protein